MQQLFGVQVGNPSTEMRVGTIAGFTFTPGNTDGVQEAAFSGPVALAQLGKDITILNSNDAVQDVSGWLAVVDHGNCSIRLVDHGSGAVCTLGGGTGFRDGDMKVARFRRPHDIVACAGGYLVVVDMGNHAIR